MSAQTEEIKSRINLVELIQSYVRLEKAGINYRGRCPFHQEKTPSFFVSPTRQTWRCFGCNKGGDHFSFVEEIEGVEFPEALKILADRAGIKIVYEDPKVVSERSRIYALCEETAKFFESRLWSGENPNRATPMMQYLLGRGVKETTIKTFRLGYAPDSWDSLYTHLLHKGFRDNEIEKAGLVIKKDTPQSSSNRKYYDRYRNRIMFPINDTSGRVIAFGGRLFPSAKPQNENEAKYINSPETPIYNKSKILFGFDKAKSAIREKDFCILVEGYMDAIMSYQAGAINTMAVCGTALTEEQLRLISRLTDKIIFAFDMDSAGQTATKRSLDLAGAYNFQRKVLVLPSGKDPADAVSESSDEYLKSLQKARPLMDYYFEEAEKRFDTKDPIGKKKAGEFFLPHVRALSNEIERSHWIQKFAELLNVSKSAVQKELEKTPSTQHLHTKGSEFSKESHVKPSRRALLERRLLMLGLTHFSEIETQLKKMNEQIPFTVLHHERLYAELTKNGAIVSSELLDLHNQLLFEKDILEEVLIDPIKEIHLCIQDIFREHYKEQIASLHMQIQHLEKNKNYDRIKELLLTVQQTASKLNSI